MQILLVNTSEGTQVGTKRRTCSLTGVAMDFTAAIAIIIPCPFVDAMADRGRGGMTPPVALPLIGIQLRAASRQVFDDEPVTSPPVRVVAHPQTLLARLTRDDTDDRGPIVGVGAMAFTPIGASAGRVIRVAMGRAFFPPRSDPTRPPQRRYPPSPRWVRWRSAGSGCAAGGYGAVGATAPARAPGGPSVPRWQSHAAAAPAWPVVGESFRRPSRSTVCSSLRRRDSDRLESGLALGIAVDPGSDNAGTSDRLGVGGVAARWRRYYRQAVQ
jgi:hypothetical protein